MSAQDNLSPQQFYHGTGRTFEPGDTIEPGHPKNFDVSRTGKVYFTDDTNYGAAVKYAKYAASHWRQNTNTPHVYQVEPTGEYEKDPDFAISKGSFMSSRPLRVTGEDHTWRDDPRWR